LFGGASADYKLTKSIEEKRNEKAAKDYYSSITDIQREAIRLFMDLVLVKVGMDIALKNETISDTLLQASTVKFDNGRMAEHEYLQMKLQAVNDCYATENYKKEYEICRRRLLDYFGITDNYDNYLVLNPEFDLPALLDFNRVMEHAEKNNPFVLNQQIKRIDAERNIYNAKIQNRITGNISFNLGTNQYAPALPDAFRKLASQQSLTVGLQVPVFQWGINKNSYKIAQNNFEMTKLDIDRDNAGFYNDLKEQVNNYNHNVNLMTLAESSFELAVMQYEASVSKFNLGKMSIYELGLAQKEVFFSMNRYYLAMKEVWDGYYTLRHLTLFDFVANRDLTETFF
jgi:outer membrane protein TolC